MTPSQRLSVVSLVVGLVLAAFIVPWSLSTVRQTTELMRQQQEMLTVPAPSAVSAEQLAAARAEAEARVAAQKTANEQIARIKAELAKLTIPAPAKPKIAPTPEPVSPAYSLVPRGSGELIPLEGWVDQPNKDRSGRIHTNLMVRQGASAAKPGVAARAPCLTQVRRPAERIVRPYGYVDVPARTILVACGA